MIRKAEWDELLKKKSLTQKEAFYFFDQLESVDLNFMIGRWKGKEVKTHHPMDGLLEAVNWYGKEFVDAETVHPLLFQKNNGELYKVNPGKIPFAMPISKLPRKLIKLLFPILSPLLRTKTDKARIRLLEYRGKVSAAMIYDQHSIYDVFRKVDENTILGVMDFKGQPNAGYFFLLERAADEQKRRF